MLAAAREAATRHRIWLHIGSLAVLVEDGKVANRGFVIDREGEVRGAYDKLHLFDVDLPTGESWRELNIYSAGTAWCWSTARRSASSALPSATTCAFRACSRGSPNPTPT